MGNPALLIDRWTTHEVLRPGAGLDGTYERPGTTRATSCSPGATPRRRFRASTGPSSWTQLRKRRWNNKGSALFNLGQMEESLECFRKALQLNKDTTRPGTTPGRRSSRWASPTRPIACFDKAIELKPKYDEACTT